MSNQSSNSSKQATFTTKLNNYDLSLIYNYNLLTITLTHQHTNRKYQAILDKFNLSIQFKYILGNLNNIYDYIVESIYNEQLVYVNANAHLILIVPSQVAKKQIINQLIIPTNQILYNHSSNHSTINNPFLQKDHSINKIMMLEEKVNNNYLEMVEIAKKNQQQTESIKKIIYQLSGKLQIQVNKNNQLNDRLYSQIQSINIHNKNNTDQIRNNIQEQSDFIHQMEQRMLIQHRKNLDQFDDLQRHIAKLSIKISKDQFKKEQKNNYPSSQKSSRSLKFLKQLNEQKQPNEEKMEPKEYKQSAKLVQKIQIDWDPQNNYYKYQPKQMVVQMIKSDKNYHKLFSLKPLPKTGKHNYSIKILVSKNRAINFGIITQDIINYQYTFYYKQSIQYSFQSGNIGDCGNVKKGGSSINVWSIVRLQLDMNKNQVSWYSNNSLLAISEIQNIFKQKKIYLSIEMKDEGDKIQFV